MKVVFCTVPLEAAESLSFSLVDQGVAACVSQVPGVISTFFWKGEVNTQNEVLLIIKTSDDALSELMTIVAALHPYDVPEIIALDVANAHAPYAAWVEDATSEEDDD